MSNTLELSGFAVCLEQLIKFFSTLGYRKLPSRRLLGGSVPRLALWYIYIYIYYMYIDIYIYWFSYWEGWGAVSSNFICIFSHCSFTFFVLISCSLYTQVILILILNEAVFSFEKGSKSLLLMFPQVY